MKTTTPVRLAGLLMVGVFLTNVYLGLYDSNLSKFSPTHYYVNWVIAVASLVAAIFLLWKPRSGRMVALAGIVWPIAYALALAVDVYTKLCLGGDSAYCWPSRTAAFDYLILNNPNISGSPGYGWQLAPVVPVAIVLLVIVFLISLVAVISTRKGPSVPDQRAVPAEAKPSTAPQQ